MYYLPGTSKYPHCCEESVRFRCLHEVDRGQSQSGVSFFSLGRCMFWCSGDLYLGGGFKYMLLFSPGFSGEMIQFDKHVFQWGWNHQLVTVEVLAEKNEKSLLIFIFQYISWASSWEDLWFTQSSEALTIPLHFGCLVMLFYLFWSHSGFKDFHTSQIGLFLNVFNRFPVWIVWFSTFTLHGTNIYPLTIAGTFESMIFLFQSWDMYPFPGDETLFYRETPGLGLPNATFPLQEIARPS